MGQRLNIEIASNEGTLANAYYHWSAYTGSAIALTREVLEAYEKYVDTNMDPRELAVRILEYTGAGVNEKERMRIAEDDRFSKLEFKDCVDRNVGLLSVTEEGIRDTESWEEGRVTINIEEETVFFSVYSEEESFDEWYKSRWFDSNVDGYYEYAKLPEIDFHFYKLTFDDFHELETVYEKSYSTYGFKRKDGSVVTWIE